MKNKIKLIGDILFYIGMVIGIYGFYQVYRLKVTLPEGVCPVDNNRSLLLIGCSLLVLSIILEWVATKNKK